MGVAIKTFYSVSKFFPEALKIKERSTVSKILKENKAIVLYMLTVFKLLCVDLPLMNPDRVSLII